MFNDLGVYQPTILLVTTALLTISLITCVVLAFIFEPIKGIDHLAKKWKLFLAIGLACTVMLASYSFIDHKNVQQFRDEGQTLRAQCVALEKEDSHSLETETLAQVVFEYNKHLETLNKVFHFPGAQAVLDTIPKI